MLTSYFYEYFNAAYRSYMNNETITTILKIYLEQLSELTHSVGYIALLKDDLLLIKACYSKETYANDPLLLVPEETICKQALITNCVQISNVVPHGEPMFELIKSAITYISIPCIFNESLIGIISLASKNTYLETNKHMFQLLGSLTGVLLNNIKMTTQIFMTCDITKEILNFADSVIVTDEHLKILYLNSKANAILNTHYSTLFPEGFNDQSLIHVFPQLTLLHDDDSNTKIYRNRQIEISIDNQGVVSTILFTFNTIACKEQIYNIVHLTNTTVVNKPANGNTCLMSYLSHELRNSIQSVILANYMIQLEIKKPMNHTKIIEKACQKMKRIVNDILDLSKIEMNELVIEVSLCNIKNLLLETINEYEAHAILKNIDIVLNIDDTVPVLLYTDSTRLSQIISNLISNAIKYSRGNKITINVLHDNIDQMVIFSVEDTGVGIKKEELCHIFKKFGKTSNSSKYKNDSTGLGLYISQKLARMMGGNINVTSEYNVGSTFAFHHPSNLRSSMNMCQSSKNAYDTDHSFSGKILLVDDEHENTNLLKLLIQNFNYDFCGFSRVESVNNGFDAVELCKITNYDIIFMDIDMPGINGITTAKTLKCNNYEGVIIAMTGDAHIFDTIENCSLFNDIIMKPYDTNVLLDMFKKHFIKNV